MGSFWDQCGRVGITLASFALLTLGMSQTHDRMLLPCTRPGIFRGILSGLAQGPGSPPGLGRCCLPWLVVARHYSLWLVLAGRGSPLLAIARRCSSLFVIGRCFILLKFIKPAYWQNLQQMPPFPNPRPGPARDSGTQAKAGAASGWADGKRGSEKLSHG